MPAALLHPTLATRIRVLTTVVVVAALAAACTGGDTAEPLPSQPPATREAAAAVPSQPAAARSDAPTTPAPASSGPSSPAATPAPGPSETERRVATRTCTLEPRQEGLPPVMVTYPSDWRIDDTDASDCGYFDPGDPEIEPATEASGVDVRAYIDAVDFASAAEPGPTLTEASRLPTAVGGFQAVRVQGTTTGEGLGPGGTRRTTWIVDLDLGTGETGGVLVVGASDRGADDYGRAVEVADDIARSAVIGRQTAGAGTVIGRTDGDGNPFTVVHRDGCVSLYAGPEQGAPLDQACDLPPAALDAVVLEDGDLQVVAGVTSPQADVARLRSNAKAAGAVATVPLRGAAGRGFAVPLSGTEASVLTETFDGDLVDQRRPVR